MARERVELSSREERRTVGAGGRLRVLALAWMALVLGFLAVSSPFLVSFSLCRADENDGAPVFRRLLLPAERLTEELKRVQDGVLVRMPSGEFDALVERAARARTRRVPPRLLEARYHAILKEESLLGEGQWRLVHTGPGPGLLSLEPFNLALRRARFENGDALIAAFDGKLPALLVDTPGERTLSLDWSARAEAGPEGLHFHLEMPSCPVAFLELDAPAGRGVTVLNDGALLSGPHEADTADLRRWKIVCGGRQRVDIRIHPAERPLIPYPSPAGGEGKGVRGAALFVRQKTTQKLHPEGLDATFELTLDGLPRGVRELVCECDAELRLRDVLGPGVDGYAFQSGKGNKPSRLTIRLREPVRAGTWQILCLAPLNGSPLPGGSRPIAWRSPGLRLVHGVPRGETLTLWLHPDLRVESWDSGTFRLDSSSLDRVSEFQILTLSGGGFGPPKRPAIGLRVHGIDFSTRQLTWWRCDAAGMALTVQIGWDVNHGQLFQLPVRLPAGWNVEKVEMTPAALLRDWHVQGAAEKATLFLDLASPLKPRSNGESERASEPVPRPAPFFPLRVGGSKGGRAPVATVHLKPDGSGPLTSKTLRFPDAVPLGARFREGALALDCDEQLYHLNVRTTAERAEPESEGPWGQQLPEYYYRYSGQPVTGEIQVHSRPPRLRAKCDSEVFVAPGDVVVETHLLLEAEAGSPSTIELSLSAGDGTPWEWRNQASPRGEDAAVNRVRHAERVYSGDTSSLLHLLASSHPLQAAAALAAWPTGERWRLTLARPLRTREPLPLHARRRLQPRDNRWSVPLPVVLGAERMEGEVMLHLQGADLVHVQTVGLHETAAAVEKGATAWRTFRYGQSEVGLALSGQARPSDRAVVASIERARLVVSVGANGVSRHHFAFQVANWNEHTLPLRLPPGSRPLAVQVDGHWLPRLIPTAAVMRPQPEAANETMAPVELALPVPIRGDAAPGDSVHHFEIVYMRTLAAMRLWQALDAPAPQLPVAPLVFHRVWRLPPRLMPLRTGRYQLLGGNDSDKEPASLSQYVAELYLLAGSWTRFAPRHEDRETEAQPAQEQSADSQQTLDFETEGGAQSEWQPVAGLADEQLIVVRRDVVTAVGLALALLWGLLLWLPRRRLLLLLLALALTGMGVLWLPAALRELAWWPLLISIAFAVPCYLRFVVRAKPGAPSTAPQTKQVLPAAAVVGALILGLLGWHGRAAAPPSATVYLVPTGNEASDQQTVLAPADLLDRLKALARPAPLTAGGPRTVLLDAAYECQLVEAGRLAEFSAVFSAYSLSEEASTLLVPLSGVQLVGEVLLDGARVAPVTLPAPQAGYSLPVRGGGRHKIELRFRVPVVGTVEDRNVLFTPPPLLRSRLSWRVPTGAVGPQVLVKNGAQATKSEGDGIRMEADLGAPPLPVHLHWYQPRHPPRLNYQAAYLWDLGLEVNQLTAWLRYRVEQGAVQMLEVDLPDELEVSMAAAQRIPSVSPPSWLTRFQLRDWYVTRGGGKRVLHLELPYPIAGDFQVILELLPRAPLTSPAALPLPSPRGIRAGGPHYLAYRMKPGLIAQRDTSQFLTRIGNKEFAPGWQGGPRLEASFPGVAYRSAPDRQPQLVLRLAQTPPLVQGDVEVTVRASAQRAEMDIVADVKAPNKDLAVLDWELPPRCVLASVSGEDVRTWKQDGAHLLVWLNHTTTATRLHLSGWLPLSIRDGHTHLEVSGPRLRRADKQHTRLRLSAAADLVLAEVRTRNLQPVPSESRRMEDSSDLDFQTTDFETRDSSSHLECQVRAAANASARVLTLAEATDRELRFTTTVDYTVTQGELRQVRLRLRNWAGEKVEMQAERVKLWPGPRRALGERSWVLPLQRGVRGHYRVTLRGSMSLDKAAVGVAMPDVRVQGVERAEYFVAVAGGDLIGQASGSLQQLKNDLSQSAVQTHQPSDAGRSPPQIADALRAGGQVWRVGDAEWQVRLSPRTRRPAQEPVRIYLLEHSAAVVDGRHWLHEARCWLRHEANADLALDLPAPVRVLTVAVDGVEVTPLLKIRNPKSNEGVSDWNKRVWLPLPGRPGVRSIRLRWLYERPEPLDHPNLTPPRLVDAIEGPNLDTVMVPPGWRASLAGASGWQGATREAALALWRADTQLRICQDLAKQRQDRVVSSALAAAQRQFALHCRQARHALNRAADSGGAAGPQGQSSTTWLVDLQAKERVVQAELHPAADAAGSPYPSEPAVFAGEWISNFENCGTPLSWQSMPGAEPETLLLRSCESQRTRHALSASVQWLGGLTVVWILSLFPLLLARLRLVFAEQIALLGLLGWYLAGLTSIVLGLWLVAACGRVYLLARGLRGLLDKRRAAKLNAATARSAR
ncbi:MAG: hypothetical protein ACYC3I_09515 [Gemmataceae bacterium]